LVYIPATKIVPAAIPQDTPDLQHPDTRGPPHTL
jgi:hypothetical protein